MAEKIARLEELLGDTITEVTLYMTPSGALFRTKEEAVASLIALACVRCQDCKIGNFLRAKS